MNTQFEELAQLVFNYETSHPDCPVATWSNQPEEIKDKYRVAAMTAHLIILGPIYEMKMPQPVEV